MMITTLALVALIAQLPLPRIVPPPGFTGGADAAALENRLSGVIVGTLPADVPLEDARPWTAAEIGSFMLNFQTPQPVTVIEPGAPIVAQWTWTPDPARPVGFRLWRNGEIIRNFAAADLTITSTSPQVIVTRAGVVPSFTSAQRGAHTFALTAVDTACESAQQQACESDRALATITVQVGFTSPPPPPQSFGVKGGS